MRHSDGIPEIIIPVENFSFNKQIIRIDILYKDKK